MHTEKREDPLVELGYEVRDLNTVAIRNSTIAFFIFAIGSAVIGFVCYRFMNPTVFEAPGKSHRVIPAAPNPLIQSNTATKTDIMDIRQHETEVLHAPVGWTDATKTHLHIPIDEAVKIVASRGGYLTPHAPKRPATRPGGGFPAGGAPSFSGPAVRPGFGAPAGGGRQPSFSGPAVRPGFGSAPATAGPSPAGSPPAQKLPAGAPPKQ